MSNLLPPNATELERALEKLATVVIDGIDVPIRDLMSPERCPESHLPWLAWFLSVDQWSADWPLNVRRARVASAIAIQRIKGTARSVIDVVSSFGGDVIVREWFQFNPPRDPHTFDLTVTLGGQSAGAPTSEFIDAVIAEVSRTKPVRSHFDFTVAQSARARIGLRVVGRPVIAARVFAPAI